MSKYVQDGVKLIKPYEQVGVYTREQMVKVLEEIFEEISRITDMTFVNGGLYIRECKVDEIIYKYIMKYSEEQA